MDYVDGFLYMKASLHPWDEAYVIIMDKPNRPSVMTSTSSLPPFPVNHDIFPTDYFYDTILLFQLPTPIGTLTKHPRDDGKKLDRQYSLSFLPSNSNI